MSLTATGIKGVVTDFMGATSSVTVAFQAVSAPGVSGFACKQQPIANFKISMEILRLCFSVMLSSCTLIFL